MKKYYIFTNKYTIRERITKQGRVFDIVFRVVQAIDGSIKQKSLCGFQTKAKAKTAYIDWIQRNCLPGEAPRTSRKVEPEKREPTIAELLPEYIKSLQNQNKESTIYDKKYLFDLWIMPILGNVQISDLTKDRLLQWQNELWRTKNPKTGSYYTYKYLSKIRTYFTTFLAWVETQYNYKNNLKLISKPKRLQAEHKVCDFWTKEEFNLFLENVTNQRYKTFFAILFYTGRRKGEIIALNKEDIKADKIIINKTCTRKTLSNEKYLITSTKNIKTGESYICEDLKKEIEKYEPQTPFYFGGSNPISENAINYAFKQGIQRSGVKKIRIHDLRHSFVSRLIHLGASPYVVASAIGDNVEQVFRTYGHMYEEDKKAIFKKL